jgi:hypothetical protein
MDLPLGAKFNAIGRYYQALSINRQGPQAYPEAKKILLEVADRAPDIFRAKARVALGTNTNISGDTETAKLLYADAQRIASPGSHGVLHPTFLIRFQHAFIKASEGDHGRALDDLFNLSPLATLVGQRNPGLLQIYYCNLAMGLIRHGRVGEAEPLCGILAASPLRSLFPEWEEPLALLETARQGATRALVVVPAFQVQDEGFSGPYVIGRAADDTAASSPLSRKHPISGGGHEPHHDAMAAPLRRPSGIGDADWRRNPAMNSRAILRRPSGTEGAASGDGAPGGNAASHRALLSGPAHPSPRKSACGCD